MFLKKRRSSTDPCLRSLLQKAARRGFPREVEIAARRLQAMGDGTWLRSRAVVITFEECWPLAQRLKLSSAPESRYSALDEVTRSEKLKDAAGLGALAFAYHEGDTSMMSLVPEQGAVRAVSEALDRPQQFFEWALSQCDSESKATIVTAARRYLPAATWGWDKACILAGAFLASTGDVPKFGSGPTFEGHFPYWAVLDKHTPQGKDVLRELAAELRVPYRQLLWAGFYVESTRVNALLPSIWFDAEKLWRLGRARLTLASATLLWEQVQPKLIDRLETSALELSRSIEISSLR